MSLPPKQADQSKTWIPTSRLLCYVSARTKRRTTEPFWRWVLDSDRLEVHEEDRRRWVSESSLRRYLGLDDA